MAVLLLAGTGVREKLRESSLASGRTDSTHHTDLLYVGLERLENDFTILQRRKMAYLLTSEAVSHSQSNLVWE